MRKLKVFLAAVALLAWARPVPATTVVALDDAQLVRLSKTIVHADVIGKQSYVAEDKTGRIYTEYIFRPRDILKGEANADGLIVFREWGGTVNGLHYWLPGVGEFGEGEEVLAFLGEQGGPFHVGFTTGLSQGKFHVERAADGSVRAVRTLADLHLIDPRTGAVSEDAPRASSGVDLDALKAMIKANLEK